MKKFIISILLSLLATPSFSADNLFVKGLVHFTNKNVIVFFDDHKKENIKTIDQITFEKTAYQNLNFGFYSGRFWAKFTIDSLFEPTQILEIKNPVLDDIHLYKRVGLDWVLLGKVGDIFKYSDRKVKHRFPQFLIKSKGDYLLRIDNNGDQLALKMNLFLESQIKNRDYKLQVLAGMYFGILAIVMLFNFFMFILLRGKYNLILVYYLLAMILFELSLTGYGFEWLWGNYPYLQNRMIPWAGAISLLLIIRFVVYYLKIKELSPRTHLVLKISSYFIVVNLILSFINSGPLNVFIYISNNIVTLILIFAAIPVLLASVKRRFKASRLVLISFIGVFAGALISTLNYFGFITNFFFDNINIQFGVLFQVVFLTFAVLDGYKIYKDRANKNLKEITRLKEEQIFNLEAQVSSRTTELIEQKEELERVNHEIISSINYAKRIQAALIPEENTFLQDFKNGFLSFRPKDIISGDFYWSCKIKDSNGKGEIVEKTVVCVGDTNAQGVPGSILSVLAMRVIQSLIFKKSVTSPGILLDEVNAELIKLFPKLEENKEKVNGIYCSICVIDQNDHTIEFAGAMGRVFVRKNNEVLEYNGDNRFLGKGRIKINFKTLKIQLAKNDIVYVGTDGYKKQLQFSKETKDKDLIDVLNVYASLPIEEQKATYLKTYEEMVQQHGQLDDFCIIGIQL